jgi:hypothetical protein
VLVPGAVFHPRATVPHWPRPPLAQVAFIAAGIRSGKSAPLSMLRNSEQGDDSTVGRIDVPVWSSGLSAENPPNSKQDRITAFLKQNRTVI